MKKTKAIPILIVLITSLAQTPVASIAQTEIQDFSIDGPVEGRLTDLLQTRSFESTQNKAGGLAGLTRNLIIARRNFWNKYPNKPDFKQASQDFNSALSAKDFAYLNFYFMYGPSDPTGSFIARFASAIDGGIPSNTKFYYDEWIRTLRKVLGAERDGQGINILKLPNLGSVLNSAQSIEAYNRYKKARDLHEYFAGPYSPLKSSNPETYLKGLIVHTSKSKNTVEAENVIMLMCKCLVRRQY